MGGGGGCSQQLLCLNPTRAQQNITLSEVDKFAEIQLTKRILLGFVNSFGDPLGIASPWYMKLKILMKKVVPAE